MDTNIYVRRKDKGYQYVVSYKVNGVWKQKSKQGFETSREAKKAAQIVEQDLKDLYIPSSVGKVYTFKEVALTKLSDDDLTEGTIRNRLIMLDKYKSIWDKAVEDIAYTDLVSIFESLKGRYKHNTLLNIYSFGNSTMRYAVSKLRIIKFNPFEQYTLKAPKVSDSTKRKALVSSDLDKLICLLPDDYKLITALMGYGGLRISEARGLRRCNIDLKKNEMTIEGQKDNQGKFTNILKSKNSYRIVPISPKLREVLLASPLPFDFVVPERMYSTSLKLQYQKLGFDITPHDLRHTFTTLLVQKNIDFKTIALLIGDRVEEVLKTYSHVNDDMYQEAKKIMLENF